MINILNKEGIQYDACVTLTTIICYKCATPFAIPEKLRQHLKETRESFFCPHGHSQAYVKSSLTEMKEKHEKEISTLQRNLNWEKEQKENAVKQRTVIKGQMTKLKNRVKNGVCPCCNRSFHNLQQHMATKHPEYNSIN